MMAEAAAGHVKGMYIVGENPVASFPDSAAVEHGLTTLDFLLVQDIFPTETAALASVVLPAASFAEKDGTFTNFEGRVQAVRQALRPLGDSRPDWEIMLALAAAMGSPLPFETLSDIEREIVELVPFYEAVGEGGDGAPAHRDGQPWSRRRLYERLFPSTFGRFWPVDYVPEEGPTDEYPLTLLTGAQLYAFGTGSRTSRSSWLQRFAPESYLEVAVSDARRLEISDGEEVRVVSATGALDAVAKVTDAQPAGILFAPLAFPDGRVNGLFPAIVDAKSKTPALGHCAVRLERRHPHG
ncbi:MAG: molybdopterin-dependent oxidoreductase, partial [bacterium]